MKKFLLFWFIAFVFLSFEYFSLNYSPQHSLFLRLQHRGIISKTIEISAAPGRAVSLWLGWLGLVLMVIMNVYSMRKRLYFMKDWGRLSDWLNFHVFCGLLGPTFILFHCNFKVRGLVAISFWSMVISFVSGIIGRYFYVQLQKEKSFFDQAAQQRLNQLNQILLVSKVKVTEDEKSRYTKLALAHVGIPNGIEETLNPLFAFGHAFIGDIRLYFNNPIRAKSWPPATEFVLAEFALNRRRSLFLASFQRLMGYWHSFHFPFAIFMYLVAVVHVAAALILKA